MLGWAVSLPPLTDLMAFARNSTFMDPTFLIYKIVLPFRILGTESTKTVVFKLQGAFDSTGGLIEHSLLGPTPGVADSVGLGWRLKLCMSNEFPGASAAAAVRDHTLRTNAPKPHCGSRCQRPQYLPQQGCGLAYAALGCLACGPDLPLCFPTVQ